jgi:hypothetical protein
VFSTLTTIVLMAPREEFPFRVETIFSVSRLSASSTTLCREDNTTLKHGPDRSKGVAA